VLALARQGRLEPVGAGQQMRLVLDGGEAHREDPAADEYVTAEFRHAEVVLGLGTALSDRNGLTGSAREMTIEQMDARARAERARGDIAGAHRFEGYLHRRLAAPLAVLPFALLAVPLGAARRIGRPFALAATLLAVIAHYVLMRGGEVMAQRSVLPAALALQLPNLILSALGIVLVVLQARRGPGVAR
jgi:lipopolysaccharide export system permease protein